MKNDAILGYLREQFLTDDNDLLEELTEEVVWEGDHVKRRWWTEFSRVIKVGDKFIQYQCADSDGDMSARERGWEFDWDSVIEVAPFEKVVIAYKPV